MEGISPEDQLEFQAKLAKKISKLGQEIGALAQDGRNEFTKYKYISNEQLVTALRNKAGECQVKVIPSVSAFNERDFQNDSGKLVTRSTVTMVFKVIDLETGFHELFQFVGAEQDTGGKSMQQAVTQCVKYFYFKLLDVTSREDSDGDAKTTEASDQPDTRQWLNKGTPEWQEAIKYLAGDGTMDKILKKYKINKKDQDALMEEVVQ